MTRRREKCEGVSVTGAEGKGDKRREERRRREEVKGVERGKESSELRG